MKMEMIRIWEEVDINKVKESVLIVDDKFGFCPGCREIGIKLEGLTNCPKCGRKFIYMTSRDASTGEKGMAFVRRALKKLPELKFIDHHDYEYYTAKKNAEGLFNGI